MTDIQYSKLTLAVNNELDSIHLCNQLSLTSQQLGIPHEINCTNDKSAVLYFTSCSQNDTGILKQIMEMILYRNIIDDKKNSKPIFGGKTETSRSKHR